MSPDGPDRSDADPSSLDAMSVDASEVLDGSRSDASSWMDASVTDASYVDAPDAATPVLPSCLQPVGSVMNTVGARGQSVAAEGTMAYLGLTSGARGIQIFDVANPAAPIPLGVFRTDSGPGMLAPNSNDVLGITVRSRYAYLATYFGGMVIVDVSDPMNPSFVGGLSLPRETWAIALQGNRAFVANHTLGLVVVDISNEAAPVQVTNLPLAGSSMALHIDGTRLYVAAHTDLHILDISNPDAPSQIGQLTTVDGIFYGVWSSGNGYAYVIDKSRRELLTIDVMSIPPTVVQVRPSDHALDPRSIDGNGMSIVVGDGTGTSGRVRSFENTPPTPMLASDLSANERVFDIEVDGELVFGATFDGAVAIWRFTSCP